MQQMILGSMDFGAPDFLLGMILSGASAVGGLGIYGMSEYLVAYETFKYRDDPDWWMIGSFSLVLSIIVKNLFWGAGLLFSSNYLYALNAYPSTFGIYATLAYILMVDPSILAFTDYAYYNI